MSRRASSRTPIPPGAALLLVGPEERLGVRRWIRTPAARSCGRSASVAAASRAACTSAWRARAARLFVPIADLADGHDGRKYDSAPRPGLYALDARTGRTLWSVPAPQDCSGRKFCDIGHLGAADGDSRGRVCRPHGRHAAGLRRSDRQGHLAVRRQRAGAQRSRAPRRTAARSAAPGLRCATAISSINSGYGLYFHMPGNVLLVFRKAR